MKLIGHIQGNELRVDFYPEHRYPAFLPHFFMLCDWANHEWDVYSEFTVWSTGEMKPPVTGHGSFIDPLDGIEVMSTFAKQEFADWQKRASSK